MPQPFSVSIERVVDLLGLERSPKNKDGATSFNVKCPFCGDKKYHMNINIAKDTYNCVHCTGNHTGGGALDLYCRAVLGEELRSGSDSEGGNGKRAYRMLMEALESNSPAPLATGKSDNQRKNNPPAVKRASDDKTHEAYCCVLKFPEFSLSEAHFHALQKRGLDASVIVRNRYRTIPESCGWVRNYPKVSAKYKSLGLDASLKRLIPNSSYDYRVACFAVGQFTTNNNVVPSGVPGFFCVEGFWFFKVEPGMLIPTRNRDGKIVALQARRDKGNLRYMTISSKQYPAGVTEGISRIHFPLHNAKLHPNATVLITEGPLKADVAHFLMRDPNLYLIALQGVNNRSELDGVFNMLYAAGIRTVYNALDMDKLTNPHVASASRAIRSQAKKAGIAFKPLVWDSVYAQKKCDELFALCRKWNIDTTGINGDVFSVCGKLADVLYRNGIRHSVEIRKGEEVKRYWNDKTKGIDDALLLRVFQNR